MPQKVRALDKKCVVWYSISVTKAFLRPFFDFYVFFRCFFADEIPKKSGGKRDFVLLL